MDDLFCKMEEVLVHTSVGHYDGGLSESNGFSLQSTTCGLPDGNYELSFFLDGTGDDDFCRYEPEWESLYRRYMSLRKRGKVLTDEAEAAL